MMQVDFDKTKHLAESTIKKREKEREKLIQREREKEEAERRAHRVDCKLTLIVHTQLLL